MGDLEEQRREKSVSDASRLRETDREFIRFCRRLKWGKVEVMIKDGEPVMASVIREDFRFDV